MGESEREKEVWQMYSLPKLPKLEDGRTWWKAPTKNGVDIFIPGPDPEKTDPAEAMAGPFYIDGLTYERFRGWLDRFLIRYYSNELKSNEIKIVAELIDGEHGRQYTITRNEKLIALFTLYQVTTNRIQLYIIRDPSPKPGFYPERENFYIKLFSALELAYSSIDLSDWISELKQEEKTEAKPNTSKRGRSRSKSPERVNLKKAIWVQVQKAVELKDKGYTAEKAVKAVNQARQRNEPIITRNLYYDYRDLPEPE